MRGNNVKTYGKHTYRPVRADVWLSDNDKKVFATSSENDSSLKHSSIFHSSSSSSDLGQSLNSTGDSSAYSGLHDRKQPSRNTKTTRATRSTKNADENKENRVLRNKRLLQQRKEKTTLFTSASDSSTTDSNPRPRPLRDRNRKVVYDDDVNSKKHYRERRCKRKRPERVVTTPKNPSINFSDFDDYNLIVSDSPPVTESGNVPCVDTSTPVAKRTRRHSNHAVDNLKEADISVIDLYDSPMSPTCGGTVPTPESSARAGYSYLTNGSPYLESLESIDMSHSQKRSYLSEQSKDESLPFIQKVKDNLGSLKSSHISGVSSRLRSHNSGVDVSNELTASLFESSVEEERSVHVVSEKLKNINLKKQQSELESLVEAEAEDDSVEEEEENLSEEEDEVDDDEEDDEQRDSESEAEDESLVEEDEEASDATDEDTESECLSIVHEGDSVEEEEETESDETIASDEEHSETDDRLYGKSPLDKSVAVNLQRLSESFINNFVSARKSRNARNVWKAVDTEPSGLSDADRDSSGSFEKSRGSSDSASSNSTLYCLNEDYDPDKSWGSAELFDSESMSGSESSRSQSRYKTALLTCISEDDYHTALEGSSVDERDKQGALAKTSCYTPKACRLRNKELEDLRHSFTEMLTPVRLKRKSSLVPISFQTKVCILCDQLHPISFKEALPNKMLPQCKKIGEGVYGEVFRSCRNGDSVAIKIIPIEGDFPVNDEPQKTYEEIIPEIVIAKELSDLRTGNYSRTSNFCEVNNVSLVQGRYPTDLLKQWDIFHKSRVSENDRPDIFKDNQLYIVFEFADCGRDLESYQFESLQQAKSVLTQVTFALAVAEETLQFEHRDLHWGNVLIKQTKEEDAVFKFCGKRMCVPTMGVEANIIDFTLSRLTKDACTVHTDLSKDDTLFEGKGDYQFDIYRNMKSENNNNWEEFHPRTNVFWLHYLADKLVYAIRYPSKSSRQDRELTRQFRQFMSEMLNYSSSCEMAVEADFLNS